VRNAAYRAQRKGGTAEQIEAERTRARGGQLASPGAGRAAGTPRASKSGRNSTVAGDGHYYILQESAVTAIGKDKNGNTRYACTPTDRIIIDFTQPGVETDREGARIEVCPNCGKRGEYHEPRGGWAKAVITHRRALVGRDRQPRMLEYCSVGRNTAATEALRDFDRDRRAANREEGVDA